MSDENPNHKKEHRIKQTSEDFLVKEISSVKLVHGQNGEYAVFRMRKREYTTERAAQVIAEALHIDRKRVGYAGAKDSKAVTEQLISLRNVERKKIESISLKDISLEFAGFTNEPISLGDLEGNSFEIVVRNIAKDAEKPKKISRIVNYFGEQRFSKNNAEIGKAIIKKDFKHAVDMMIDSIGREEKKVIEHLEKNRNDFVGALKEMPWKTLNMYIHAFQSKMWNEAARRLLAKEDSPALHGDAIKIPLVGFSTEVDNPAIKSIVDDIMKEEQITNQDFVIRAIPDLSSAGNERALFTEVKDMRIGELEDDELSPGRKKIKISFSLGKGSYATEVIKEMFK
jgi:tRNA pseudouridine13 synthase